MIPARGSKNFDFDFESCIILKRTLKRALPLPFEIQLLGFLPAYTSALALYFSSSQLYKAFPTGTFPFRL